MIPRAVIGKYPTGVFGMKTSLPGYNALTDDDSDPNKFSFNSQWPDLVRTHLVGIATSTVSFGYPYLGYVPFAQVKHIRDGWIRDDWCYFPGGYYDPPVVARSGNSFMVDYSTFTVSLPTYSSAVFYAIYRIPAF